MRALLRTFGELSITAGVVLALFCAYLLWGTGAYTERQQRLLERQLGADGGAGQAAITPGRAMALLRIPRLGRDYRYAVVEGITPDHLKKGPGHHPDSALPGQIGNFVISGHRTTYAAPFNRIDALERGDEILVEARGARYTYRVTAQEIVAPTAVDVLAPVPGSPGRPALQAVITLTTCHPEYSAAQRLIVHGILTSTQPRKA